MLFAHFIRYLSDCHVLSTKLNVLSFIKTVQDIITFVKKNGAQADNSTAQTDKKNKDIC